MVLQTRSSETLQLLEIIKKVNLFTLCMLGNFSCFCCCLLTFFKITFSKNSFKNIIRVSNGLDPDQDRYYVSPDLDPNCLQSYQQMTKVAASKERVNIKENLCTNPQINNEQ